MAAAHSLGVDMVSYTHIPGCYNLSCSSVPIVVSLAFPSCGFVQMNCVALLCVALTVTSRPSLLSLYTYVVLIVVLAYDFCCLPVCLLVSSCSLCASEFHSLCTHVCPTVPHLSLSFIYARPSLRTTLLLYPVSARLFLQLLPLVDVFIRQLLTTTCACSNPMKL